MVKPRDEVIAEFNLQNNMTVDELQAWLDDPQSKKAGTGVGIESGHKIVEILKKNPNKDPEQYDDVGNAIFARIYAAERKDTGGHRAYAEGLRVGLSGVRIPAGLIGSCRYNKRHMAQEDHLKETKTKDELENTKSTIR